MWERQQVLEYRCDDLHHGGQVIETPRLRNGEAAHPPLPIRQRMCLCNEYQCDDYELLCDWCYQFYMLENRVIAYLDDMHN